LKKKRQYNVYHFTWKDWLEYSLRFILKGSIICYLFYDSCKAFLLLIPFLVLDYKNLKKKKLEKLKRGLTLQFKTMMEALVTSLTAGYALEKAFGDAQKDLELVYDRDAVIFEELYGILSGLKMNIPLETSLKDFGERSGIDDIRNFANVVSAAKKSGGNLIRIIEKTVNTISDKIAVEEEIKTLIAAKKLEGQIMLFMPYGIIFYLRVSNGEFLQVLYHNMLGAALMTFFLAAIYVAKIWSERIMEIQV